MTASCKILVELFRRKEFDAFVTNEGKTNEKQLTALELLTDYDTVGLGFGGAAGGGKSDLGCSWEHMMALTYPGTRYFMGREELKRLRESTLMTFFKVSKRQGSERDIDWIYNGQDHYIEFKNGSRIDLLDLKYLPSDPLYERYGSVEYTSGWLEEAGETEFGAWDVLKTRIGRCQNDKYGIRGKLLATLNPKKNWTHKTFWTPYRDKQEKDGIRFIPSLVTDNPFIEQDYIKNLESITDIVQKQRLLFGNFDYDDSDNCLMPYNKIMDIFTNSFVEGGQSFISADLAITNDSFVLIAWSGFRVKEIRVMNNISKPVTHNVNGEVTTRIDFGPLKDEFEKLRVKYEVPMSNVVYDADGIGHHMKSIMPGAIALHTGITSIEPQYMNLKANLYFRLADMVNADKVYIDYSPDSALKERIISELQAVKRSSDVGEKLKLMSKADVKLLIGHSPDISDALAYRILFYLTRRT